MKEDTIKDGVLECLLGWAENTEQVRAVLITSSRASNNGPVDRFSDYDIILVVRDIHPFFKDRNWLQTFGRVLVLYGDPIQVDHGFERFAFITQYEDGTKIDFNLCPVELVVRLVADSALPNYLDCGYAVLLDKDHLSDGLKPPPYRAYIPDPPSEAAYQNLAEEFFQEATYVAKHLWRDDLLPARYNLDHAMKQVNLRTMLEWRMEIDQQWTAKPGAYGKGLKKVLRPDIWSELERTYVGAGVEENWQALFRTIALFRKVGVEVAAHLKFEYSHELDRRVTSYLQKIKRMDQ